jgi:CheY-like chemotaxis protein
MAIASVSRNTTGPHRLARAPAVLLAAREPLLVRSIATMLETNGVALLAADSPDVALRVARLEHPDLILVDNEGYGNGGIEACRQFRHEPHVGPHTPILLAATAHPTRPERLAALRAGAWDVLDKPLDPEETLLRINAYVRPKLVADVAIAEALVDSDTGLYNVQGLARLARELGHLAVRQHLALACVVAWAHEAAGGEANGRQGAAARCTRVLRAVTRSADVLGRLAPLEFGLVAPATDLEGARRLARRLERAAADLPREEGEAPIELRVGYDAVTNMAYTPTDALELLGRAAARARGAAGTAP